MKKVVGEGQALSPVRISGRKIARTFWGKAWCDNLERYHDFENRLPRGRTYVRNGSVLDLQVGPCALRAMVSGSSLYYVSINIAVLPKGQWRSICRDCAGGIESVVELLQGRLSKSVMERVCHPQNGLFPRPSEIEFTCSCPDYAFMCKHIAAVLYGVGARLDEQPELLFQLRAVDQTELVTDIDSGLLLSETGPDSARRLADGNDISALFGLDMADDTPPSSVSATTKRIKSKATKSKRQRSSTRAVSPGRDRPKRSAMVRPNVSGTTDVATAAPARSPQKRPAPRSASAHVASVVNARNKVAAPRRASSALSGASAREETPENSTRQAKRGKTPARSRLRRS
ncbi:MAG: SWIM zinc finger family protein [Alphaproteobacteria bacterium]|nr:SWIM zinc finger family protein [Alphaproteobacteria bacterium]